MLVGSIACSCGRHLTWRCGCGAVTYGPALAEGCSLLDGPHQIVYEGRVYLAARAGRLGVPARRPAVAGGPDRAAARRGRVGVARAPQGSRQARDLSFLSINLPRARRSLAKVRVYGAPTSAIGVSPKKSHFGGVSKSWTRP